MPLQHRKDQLDGVELGAVGDVEDVLYLQLLQGSLAVFTLVDTEIVHKDSNLLLPVRLPQALQVLPELLVVDGGLKDLPVLDALLLRDAHQEAEAGLVQVLHVELVVVESARPLELLVLGLRVGGLVDVDDLVAQPLETPQLLSVVHTLLLIGLQPVRWLHLLRQDCLALDPVLLIDASQLAEVDAAEGPVHPVPQHPLLLAQAHREVEGGLRGDVSHLVTGDEAGPKALSWLLISMPLRLPDRHGATALVLPEAPFDELAHR